MPQNDKGLNPIDGLLLELLGDYHRHLCSICDGAEDGCFNCRHTGYNQTPCLICDKDGIAFKRRKEFLVRVQQIFEAEKKAAVESLLTRLKVNVSDPSKRNDRYYFEIGYEAMATLENLQSTKDNS